MKAMESAARQFGVLDHAPVGMCVIGSDFTVLFWNRCLADWTRIRKADIVGQDLCGFFPHFREPKYASRLMTIFDGGPPAIFSSQLHKYIFPSPMPNGELRIQHTTVSGIPCDKGHNALFAVEDVTELTRQIKKARESRNQAVAEVKQRKKAEEGLRTANRRILEQQKAVIEEERLKMLLQLAGATAYELNQPLTALLGNVQLMNLEKADPAKLDTRLARIEESGKQIARIVKKIQTIRNDEDRNDIEFAGGEYPDRNIAILSVEDSELEFKTLKKILGVRKHIRLSNAQNIESAFKSLKENRFDLIFLDFFLSDGTGMDFIRALHRENIETPVVVVTGKGDEVIASQVIQAGAYGYIPKSNLNRDILLKTIPETLEKARLKGEMKAAREKLAEMSIRDELTGLYNRRYFAETLKREMAGAERYGHGLVLCMTDLDRFKSVNDTYGHPCGDTVLREFARILRESSRDSDIPCRYGGEEFAIILPKIDRQSAGNFYGRVRRMLAEHQFEHESSKFHVTVSAGIAEYDPLRHGDMGKLIADADQALYQAKNSGRDRVVFFEV